MQKQILIVDDSTDMRSLVATILEHENLKFSCASNGEEALRFLRENHSPMLILLDWEMSVMDGPTFLKELKAPTFSQRKNISVLLMTAREPQSEVKVDGVLKKPFEIDKMVEKIREFIPH